VRHETNGVCVVCVCARVCVRVCVCVCVLFVCIGGGSCVFDDGVLDRQG